MLTTELLLGIGRYAFLGLLYLFVLLVLRALLAEMRTERPASTAERRLVTSVEARPALSPRPPEPDVPAPATSLPPRLVVVETAAPEALPIGTSFALTAVTTIGRGTHNSVALPMDKHVSSNHALVYVKDGSVYLRDRDSTNGTYVNGKRVEAETPLSDGDRVTVGMTVLRFSAPQASARVVIHADEDG